MYLMDVPPVVVTRTEWRTCGTPRGYSLPLCLNDSDSDLSTRGTPISDKVQMIIESLRSTQSSVEMGDENERKALSGQEGHSQVCKVTMGSFVGATSNSQDPISYQNLNPPAVINESHDSDSDDSVDRGIEAAILEYLKEKDGPKRKSETCSSNSLQPSKFPRGTPAPGISKMNSDDNAFLTASEEFPKSVKLEEPVTATSYPIKKYIKHKTSINEGPFAKQELNKNISTKNDISIAQTNQASKYLSDVIKTRHNLVGDSDSSSDDGIEEAIQKYQMEKKQQIKRETPNLHTLSEDSVSSSDDGIEEAIRCYQLEQLQEKNILKPLSNKTKKIPVCKYSVKGHQGTNTENLKKRKQKKKKMKREVLPVNIPSNTLLDGIKGNGLHSFKVEGFKGQCVPPKTNTSAELMCAEAILDISKTVMPGAFQQTPSLSNSSLVRSCVQPSLSDSKPEDKSDDSSIDSEDGIEQEIRRFLEQKAQMHKQTLSSAAAPEPGDTNESVKTKCVSKPGRLSLTKRRKQTSENLSLCTMSALSNVKSTLSTTSADSSDESTSPTSPIHTLEGEQSGDKSSSLDSDEDLDLAIKDLLKTKKKVKKKTRDLKRKPEKCFKKEELQVYASLSKKTKTDNLKHSSLKKLEKTKTEMHFSKSLKHNLFQNKGNTGNDVNKQECESSEGTDLTISTLSKPIKEEDSSVDSDDSIELEIRRFLAEKAKVAPAENNKNKPVSANGIAPVCSDIKAEDLKPENQLAEIPSKNKPLPGSTENNPAKEKLPLLSPQVYPLRNFPAGAQSPSSPTCCPSLLEHATEVEVTNPRTPNIDGANIQGAGPSKEAQSAFSPHLTPSQSASIKWRQSLGLPIMDTKIRTPFQISSSKTNDSSSATRPSPSVMNLKIQNTVWSSTKTTATSFPRNTETMVNAGFHPHAPSYLSSARQHPGPFTQRLAPSFSSQYHIEEETKSMVHISKDKTVYVELESNRTNHVQVRSRDRCEEKESQDLLSANSRERKSEKMEDKEVGPEIKEENFIDEAVYESGNKSDQEKKQGLSTL
uniref:Protein phosphatase 1, regulatory subunit 26 n=1 Tax=Neogobius melanostomus TaxID=47308 RepID=A0A8C6TT35_9GOBI